MASKELKHEIVSITSDRDRVRYRPTIYTTSTDAIGCAAICAEIWDNALDEVTSQNSVGDSVKITFDDKTKVFSVEDNGGGIPHKGMLNAVSVLSSSGKYANGNESHYLMSSGINGYGLKLSCFLSDWSTYESIQNGKKLMYKFDDGELKDTIETDCKGHGTKVTCKISQRFMDINALEPSYLKDRIEEKSYLFPSVSLSFTHLHDGKVVKEYKYKGKTIQDKFNGFKPDTPAIHVEDTRKQMVLENITDDSLTEKKILVDLYFAYKEDVLDADNKDRYLISYANNIHTYLGGTHIDGLKDGVVKYFKQEVLPKFKGKDKELNILPSDMTAGLCAFVTVKLVNPVFEAQFKSRITNPEVKYAVRDAVYETLCKAKTSDTNKLVEFVKRVTRGRMASKKVRKKDVSNAFSKDRLDKFQDIVYNLDTVATELILCEGRHI